ncbi:MSC_0622 family F1-like ATPase gamma subunit [Metamycoplasma equirhinis]|uniref:MSC_0622 family F1-like ATPase gamma subunit n=1 Tax=Metamycoplasma equirhinis TaxID=92402 RepID=UPI0035937B64
MQIKKVEKKLNNLKNISLKVNNEKNIYLINIMKLNQKLSYFIRNCAKDKDLILLIQKKFAIKNSLIGKIKTKFSKSFEKLTNFVLAKRNLWIYLTEEQKYETDSYSRYEEKILEMAKKHSTDFITIGKRAEQFCKTNQLNIIQNFDIESPNLSSNIASIVKILYWYNDYENVYFVINSNKNYNMPFQILPITQFNINKIMGEDREQASGVNLNIEKVKIYPNVSDYIKTEIDIFLENAISALIVESSFYKAKIGLVTTNKIIKELDEEVNALNKKIVKFRREREIEDIVLITKNNKNFSM